VTDRASREIVTLPLHSGGDTHTVERVVAGVRDFFGERG
jgi:hypothetical protein